MNELQDIIKKNQQMWEEEVEAGKQYTIPNFDLNIDLLRQFANGELLGWDDEYGKNNNALLKKIRQYEYADIKAKKVLCLASGGGQQSAMFSLLGADVTVVDITQGQLDADIKAANHYGYTVKTVLCSMTDLSVFEDEYFDIVHQPISICFVPDVALVYKEVFRVLKKGGLYHVDHINPATHPTSYDNVIDGWDGIGYRISSPYIGGPLRIDEKGNENMISGEVDGEFRHLFIDIFCKLTEAGFQIKYIWEDERNLVTAFNTLGEIKPSDGEYDSSFSVVQRYINVLSTK
jgi:ubiquinone/menaquinone biosynthesis C-methylase UbiE